MPRLTIIIPTYNWSSVLPFSIGSVLRQTFTDWELLVIGDACTDDSESVVRPFATAAGQDENGHDRIRWINLPENAGSQYAPNNEGLRQARGELIAYLGHDDLWLPHHLQTQVAAIDAGADLAHSIIDWIYPENWVSPINLFPQFCVTSSVVHRRHIAEDLGGWRDYRDIELPTDIDLWYRIHGAGYRMALVPRLGVVKFPAAMRRDVYKTRPCHEQALWFERIGRESDLEATELARMLCASHNELSLRDPRWSRQVAHLLFRVGGRRARRRLQRFLPQSLKRFWPKPRNGAQTKAWRKYKGLEPES